MSRMTRILFTFSLAFLLSLPQLSLAIEKNTRDEHPTGLAMTGDVLVARPLGAVATVLGSVLFVIALPFTLMGGNTKQAAETLIVGPGKATFVRCLGCKNTGYKTKKKKHRSRHR